MLSLLGGMVNKSVTTISTIFVGECKKAPLPVYSFVNSKKTLVISYGIKGPISASIKKSFIYISKYGDTCKHMFICAQFVWYYFFLIVKKIINVRLIYAILMFIDFK